MNRKHHFLDQIKLYSVLVSQQEDMLDTFEKLKQYDPSVDFTKQQAELRQFINENIERIRSLQQRIEGLDRA